MTLVPMITPSNFLFLQNEVNWQIYVSSCSPASWIDLSSKSKYYSPHENLRVSHNLGLLLKFSTDSLIMSALGQSQSMWSALIFICRQIVIWQNGWNTCIWSLKTFEIICFRKKISNCSAKLHPDIWLPLFGGFRCFCVMDFLHFHWKSKINS